MTKKSKTNKLRTMPLWGSALGIICSFLLLTSCMDVDEPKLNTVNEEEDNENVLQDDTQSSSTSVVPDELDNLKADGKIETARAGNNSFVAAIDTYIETLMQNENPAGVTVAFAKDGHLVFTKGYGYKSETSFVDNGHPAYQSSKEDDVVTASTIFRIASLSKSFTAVAVMNLIEDGFIPSWNTDIFNCNNGILDNLSKYGSECFRTTTGSPIPISIANAAEHGSGGFHAAEGISRLSLYNGPYGTADAVLTNALNNTNRGYNRWAMYSYTEAPPDNMGYKYDAGNYIMLGRVVEHASGMTYEDYVKKEVLAPCGVSGMHVGENNTNHRHPQESDYHSTMSTYGLRRNDATGGWKASAKDLVRFGVKFPEQVFDPNQTTLNDMLTRHSWDYRGRFPDTLANGLTDGKAGKKKGWDKTSTKYFFGGTMTGTKSTLVNYFSKGMVAAMISNRNIGGARGTLEDIIEDTTIEWPEYDMFVAEEAIPMTNLILM